MKTIITLTSLALLSFSCTERETTTTETSADPAAATQTAATPYPLDVCIVAGEELGSMGAPVVIVHEGQEIKFCCDKCVPKFKEDPEKYLSKLEQ